MSFQCSYGCSLLRRALIFASKTRLFFYSDDMTEPAQPLDINAMFYFYDFEEIVKLFRGNHWYITATAAIISPSRDSIVSRLFALHLSISRRLRWLLYHFRRKMGRWWHHTKIRNKMWLVKMHWLYYVILRTHRIYSNCKETCSASWLGFLQGIASWVLSHKTHRCGTLD